MASTHAPVHTLTGLQSHQVGGHFAGAVLQLGPQSLLVGFVVVFMRDMFDVRNVHKFTNLIRLNCSARSYVRVRDGCFDRCGNFLALLLKSKFPANFGTTLPAESPEAFKRHVWAHRTGYKGLLARRGFIECHCHQTDALQSPSGPSSTPSTLSRDGASAS